MTIGNLTALLGIGIAISIVFGAVIEGLRHIMWEGMKNPVPTIKRAVKHFLTQVYTFRFTQDYVVKSIAKISDLRRPNILSEKLLSDKIRELEEMIAILDQLKQKEMRLKELKRAANRVKVNRISDDELRPIARIEPWQVLSFSRRLILHATSHG